jgi:DNA transformation protein
MKRAWNFQGFFFCCILKSIRGAFLMKNQYAQFVLDTLKPHGPITAKPLFGGYAFYCSGIIFAIIVEDELYFKVDKATSGEFEALESKPFIYQGKAKTVTMSYMTLPESILADREQLPLWIRKACEVSMRSKKVPQKSTEKKLN